MSNTDKATVPLFRDGEEFFPRLFWVIKNARHEVIVETFELGEDRVGYDLLRAMRLAMRRGAKVYLTIDDWGSKEASQEFRQKFIDAGVHFQLFEPLGSSPLGRFRAYGRLHRKLAVIDGKIGFIGGINLRHCHMLEHEEAKRDVAAEIIGPKVEELRNLCLSHLPVDDSGDVRERKKGSADAGKKVVETSAEIRFLFRNNRENDSMIEEAWADLIDAAEHNITLAVAYFFPGESICQKLIQARQRGLDVCLIIQAKPDEILVHSAAQSLYNEFLSSGIRIVEYKERHLHAKVIEVDGLFTIIGSSNLDPWSLHLNYEASVIIEDKDFALKVRGFLDELIEVAEPIEDEQAWLSRAVAYSSRSAMKGAFSAVAALLQRINPRDPIIVAHNKNSAPDKFRLKGESSKKSRNPLKRLKAKS